MTENTQKRSKGYYESLGMCRYTLILNKSHKEKLISLAKEFHITQGSVIEAFLDHFNKEEFVPHFKAKVPKGTGVGRKTQSATQRDLINMLKGMTPEQLEAAQKSIQAVKTPEPV